MKKAIQRLMLFVGIIGSPGIVLAQEEGPIAEEESAAVSLEEYSDEFQESFFEGLKQKGIQNYDKAINAFLKCKDLEPQKDVIPFELAKTYLLDKQYINAQQYAVEAVSKDPANYWYAYTLAESLRAQNATVYMIKDQIPWKNKEFKSNLAEIYYDLGDYNQAKSILEGLEKTQSTVYLASKVKDSIAKDEVKIETKDLSAAKNDTGDTKDLQGYERRITNLINNGPASELLKVSEEALENYPAQPFFYYANGYALNKTNKNKEAIEPLETALDYLINNESLENKIYKELAEVYTALGDTEKAALYQKKAKPGF